MVPKSHRGRPVFGMPKQTKPEKGQNRSVLLNKKIRIIPTMQVKFSSATGLKRSQFKAVHASCATTSDENIIVKYARDISVVGSLKTAFKLFHDNVE